MKSALHQIRKLGRLLASTALLALALILATVATAQDSQFAFDANGNLAIQAVATIAPPQILAQPQDQIVDPGASASFIVVAASGNNLTYQWRFNGANIAGATIDTLLITNVSALNVGDYTVVLVNGSGSVTSSTAILSLDGDRDDLPDSWELANFGGLDQHPTGDYDGDGVSNADEFLDGTDPADAASRLFRLTVFSDGGQVTVSPSRFRFTNGEIVTLTATAFAPNTFHGWTGDTNTLQPTISLAMTANKTVFAHLGPYDITWTNTSGGDWNIASNWSPNFVPSTNDNVFINSSVTVTLNSAAEVASLNLGASTSTTLTGSGTLTVNRSFIWTRGTMSGSGRTIIAPGATLTIDNTSITLSGGRTLENGGTILWNGAGSFFISSAVITNRPGALFEIQSAATLTPPTGAGPSRFDNSGIIRKTSAGTTTIGGLTAFNNYNALEIQNGTLTTLGGGLNNSTVEVSAGATLNLAGGTFVGNAASSIFGPGNFSVGGGTVTLAGLANVNGTHSFNAGTANLTGNYICTNNTLVISGGTANFIGTGTVAPSVVNQDSGTMGGNQLVNVGSMMNWTGGTMTGSGRTIIPPGVTLNIGNTINLTGGRTLENGGTVLWTGGSFGASGAVITNWPGALFEVRNSAGLNYAGNTGSRFDNAGMFRKTTHAGTTLVFGGMAFNNYNIVEIQTGTLSLAGGGTHTGSFDVPGGTTLNLAFGTHTASAASIITGAGNFTVSGATVTLAGLVNVSGTHQFDAGTINVTGNYICTSNTLVMSGATVNFNGTGTVIPALVNMDGGTIGGGQIVTVGSVMNWTGGTMTGSGRTIIPPGAVLNVGNTVSLTGARTLENGGTVLWTGGNFGMGTASVITNRPGALFEVRNAAGLNYSSVVGSRFDNSGTFRKSVSAGTTTVFLGMAFNNFNAVEIQTGTLTLSGGTHTGTFDVPAGTTLNLRGTEMAGAGSSIAGAGDLIVGGGTATLAGLVNVTGTHLFDSGTAHLTGNYVCTNNTLVLSGGTANFNGTGIITPSVINQDSGTMGGSQIVTVGAVMNWTGGTMTGSGRTIVPPGAALNIGNTVSLTGGRILENGGTVLWTGGNFAIGTTVVITNRAGALFEVRNAAGLNYTSTTGSRFDNAGTFRKAISTGTTTVFGGMAFNNYNTVEIFSGILVANGGYNFRSNSLLHLVLGGTSVGVGYGRLQIGGGTAALDGNLRLSLTNGFVPASNDVFSVVTAGTRSGSFRSFLYPSNMVTMQMSNTPNSVIVRVIGVGRTEPILLPPQLSGADIRLTWTAVSNATYQVEYKSDLGSSNWIVLPGDVTSLSNNASKLEPFTSSNRFYRVRVVP